MFDVHIVSHTHWDREWYLPLERFRQRLVALVDELIDDPPAAGESFLLDGQAIVVEDYLDIRPDRERALTALLADGRLEAGPWYVLADELIPSGEAIVRNLLTGRRILRRLGATIPSVLYCPDSFGHPAALPTIAAGFGFPLIVLWRGYGSARWPSGDTANWIGPNGERVLLFHLPRDGYEYGSHLPTEPSEARARWSRMRAELGKRSATGVLLIQNGADHHARQLHARQAIAALIEAGKDDDVHASSLTRFARALVERANGSNHASNLPEVRGELRDSYGYTWTLQGTFGTRAHEKRMNAIAERCLLREAEPWSALAAMRGMDQQHLANEAWRTLLRAHPHDTLCGCSIDDVADAMELRVRSATNQAIGIRDDALLALLGHDPVAARAARDRWKPIVVVRNAAARSRSGVAIIEVEEFLADAPVGLGSAQNTALDASAVLRRVPGIPGLGRIQVLSRSIENRRTESPRHYPDNDLVAVTQVAAWVSDVLPYGVTCHAFDDVTRRSPAPDKVVVAKGSMRNAHLALEVDARGRVTLAELATHRRIESLIEFADESDVGDLYTPAPRARPHLVEGRGVRIRHRGPLRGELEATYRIRDTSTPRRHVDAEIVVRFTLDAARKFVRIAVQGDNRRENHRIRMRLRSDVLHGEVWADAAFGAVRREPIVVTDAERAIEAPPATAPLHRYVSRFDATRGFTIISDGLAEYEATADGAIVVTLLRGVRELSRNDIPERPSHAGWPTPTPGAQCLGPFGGEFAVVLHGPRDAATIDTIERAADDALVPLVGSTLRSALRVPDPVAGVELIGAGLAVSAIKQSEDGSSMVLRCLNLTDEPVVGVWRLPFELHGADLARLDETVIQQVKYTGRDVRFTARARDAVTVLLR